MKSIIRTFDRGEAMQPRPGETLIEHINVNYLEIVSTPAVQDAVEDLLSRNFASEFFVSEREAEGAYENCLQGLLVERLGAISPRLRLTEDKEAPNDDTAPFD